MTELDDFIKRYADDDNEWWRLSSGEMQNLFEEAYGRYDILKRRWEEHKKLIKSNMDAYEGAYSDRYAPAWFCELRTIWENIKQIEEEIK